MKSFLRSLALIGVMPFAAAASEQQIHIKMLFVEVLKGTFKNFVVPNLLTNASGNSHVAETNICTGLMADDKFKAVIHALATKPQSEFLAEQELTTTSGRQTQTRATEFQIYDTRFSYNGSGPASEDLKAGRVETGLVWDVFPNILSDGYTINLVVIPSFTELLGCMTSPTNAVGRINDSPLVVLPMLGVRRIAANLNMWDGQTVILGGLAEADMASDKRVANKSKVSDKEILLFITATIVDPAGNRVHKDDEMLFAQKGIPPQPK